jgi:hypothetical protein
MTIDRQKGGSARVNAQMGNVAASQPENAKEPAVIDYNEDSVKIPMNPSDSLDVTITNNPDGGVKKEIKFTPVGKPTEVTVSGVTAGANTGASWEDKLGQLKVFMQNSQFIMWAGVGFLTAGGIFMGFFRDIRSGLILIGIGGAMLISYAVLPQIYANWALLLVVGVIAVPIMWWLHYKKTERIARASIKAHESLKIKNPELAREHAKNFKEHIKPTDLNYAKKMK